MRRSSTLCHVGPLEWQSNSPARGSLSRLWIRDDLRPFDAETAQIFSQSICIVRACLPTSRNTEQPASGIGERARISADSNHTCELHLIKEIDAVEALFAQQVRQRILRFIDLQFSPGTAEAFDFLANKIK